MFKSFKEQRITQRVALSILFKIILPGFVTITLFLVAIYVIAIPKIEEDYLDSKKEMVEDLTRVVWNLLSDYEFRVISGELSRTEAQGRAINRIRQLRYGKSNMDYFWINDMHPNIIMHPYRTDLEGKDVSDFADPAGKRLFVEFANVVRMQGSGFVMYMWQFHDRADLIVPKLSFVMGFAPWGWIIGTGIYIEDIRERIALITKALNRVFFVIFFSVAFISLYIIIQGIIGENKRRQAERDLFKSEQLLRSIIEFLPDATLVIDNNERIIAWNKSIEQITGITADDMIGKGNYEYAVPFYGKRRPLLINMIMNPDAELENNYAIVKREGNHLVGEAFTPAIGTEGRYLHARAALLYDSEGNVSGAIETIRDITDLKKTEERLLQSVKEKVVLIKEVHHRVKNNLQIISSLLGLQADYISDPNDLNVFSNCRTQILSMAAIHEKLYQSNNFSSIDLDDILKDLVSRLSEFYNRMNSDVAIKFDVENIAVSIEHAIPLSMLINEIVTNSLKYAFPDGSGEVYIGISRIGPDKYSIVLYDNGTGFKDDGPGIDRKTFGLLLIDTLVRQLNGTMTRTAEQGTRYEITAQMSS